MIRIMSSAQTWDPATYARNARFVSDLGSPVLELLAPRPGERILDLGCGDGALTKKLVDLHCEVVAVDASAAQVEAARKLGLAAHVMNAEDLPFDEEFDAVFSNAVLHWIKRADAAIASVYRSLKPGGRLVAECGGHGCVRTVQTALVQRIEPARDRWRGSCALVFPDPGRLRDAAGASGVPSRQHCADSAADAAARRRDRLARNICPRLSTRAVRAARAPSICKKFAPHSSPSFATAPERGWPTMSGFALPRQRSTLPRGEEVYHLRRCRGFTVTRSDVKATQPTSSSN